MANSALGAPWRLHPRHLPEALRAAPRLLASAENPALDAHGGSVWDALALVMHQQLGQDALLLWRPNHVRDTLQLLSVAPAGAVAVGSTVPVASPLRDLLNHRLEAVAHVHCAHSECPLEQRLWALGMHSAVSTALDDAPDPLVLTVGFRERWQLAAHHIPAAVALTTYLQECRAVARALAAGGQWWTLPSQVPHLWRQPWRPSILRTVYDFTEVLIDATERCWPVAATPAAAREWITRLAHRACDLMARLEGVYWDSRPAITTDELLSEALLLVRGAYQLCRGDWPGCLAAGNAAPQPQGNSPTAIRRALIDWILSQLLTEQARADQVAVGVS